MSRKDKPRRLSLLGVLPGWSRTAGRFAASTQVADVGVDVVDTSLGLTIALRGSTVGGAFRVQLATPDGLAQRADGSDVVSEHATIVVSTVDPERVRGYLESMIESVSVTTLSEAAELLRPFFVYEYHDFAGEHRREPLSEHLVLTSLAHEEGYEGSDYLSQKELGSILVHYADLDVSEQAELVGKMIEAGDHELALRTVQWLLPHNPASEELLAKRREAQLGLVDKEQTLDAFKFIWYVGGAGFEVGAPR